VRLLYQPMARTTAAALPGQSDQWQYTPWGRIVVGVLLGQGLAHGLKMLFSAGWLATSEETTAEFWASLSGTVVWHSLQCASLVICTALVSAGQARGLLVGTLVGLLNGLIFLLVQHLNGEVLSELMVYGQPALHLTCGVLGGLIGTLVWRPLPTIQVPDLHEDTSAKKVHPAAAPSSSLFSGPIAWGRVLAGTVIVVCGIVWPKAVLNAMVEFSQGKLLLATDLQAQLITWEITGLVTLLGAALAGATTPNGLKQGLCVGLLAAMVLIGYHLGSSRVLLEHTIFMGFSILMLNLAGGWFGAQLFPPIAARQRHLQSALD
jgi:hypothetical protein